MKSLVIVESPTKAKTIKKFLGKAYEVDSCNGHIRDLPASAKEVPAKYKKEKWSNLGINVEKEFEPLYVISSQKKKTVKRLKDLIAQADELILATDEDREGEGISWHLLEVLKPKIPVKRIVFHEITEEAINDALKGYRDVDMNLVHAQEARRIIDRLAGYTISPLLWKKIAPGLSAGRVQSVAVELLVQRERERMRFRSGTYWDLKALLNTQDAKPKEFEAILTRLNEKRLATGKDFDESTGKLKKPDAVELLDEKAASALRDDLLKADWKISQIEKSKQKRSPAPPFITSTLQQESNRRFGLSGRDAMRTAQKLYEEGFITYMRTDSTNLSSQAVNAARSAVETMYGEKYLYKSVRTYTKKSKGAQEAHEAVRPAGSKFVTPKDSGLTGIHLKMYEMIWKRTVATQMAEAELEFTAVTINAQHGDTSADFKTSGKKILFPGFFRAYVEGSDDPEAQLEDQEKPLPDVKENDKVDCKEINALGHETKPPARFTEATLVKELEKEGVGRPSTYATIISTVQDRGYAMKESSALVPSFTAFAVTGLLEQHFPEMVDRKFTSEMERRLDEIAIGKEDPIKYLTSYYSGDEGLKSAVDRQESQIDPQTARKIDLPLEDLKDLNVYIGRFGPYVQTGKDGEQVSTSLPVSLAPSDITVEKLQELLKQSEEGPISLGNHPEADLPVFVLTGRFGPYVQLGEPTEEKKKPKRVSLLKGMTMEDIDFEMALKLLELPRNLGNHPETGKEVRAGVGRYGPFVVHDGTFKSLTKDDHVLTVELDRAVELLKQKKTGKTRKASSVLKELGEHPESGTEINLMTGRYGPYIKYGKKNISLPKGTDPEKLQKYDALELIKNKM
ncbi:MAG: type I DNA topoisomerase [Balneolales bacterium]